MAILAKSAVFNEVVDSILALYDIYKQKGDVENMIKITLVKWDFRENSGQQIKTQSFYTGREAMQTAYTWLHNPQLRNGLEKGTDLIIYPGVRRDDGPISQEDAIASLDETYTRAECLGYAPELDKLEQAYGDPQV